MKRLAASLCMACLVGCVPATSSPPAPKPVAQQPHAPPPSQPVVQIKSAPTDFSSIDEAVKALSAGAESGDSKKYLTATDWLIKQGGASIAPLGELLANPQTGLKTAIATCRALGKLGPDAAPHLINALAIDKPQLLRVNGAEQLGVIEPTNDDIVNKLISLLDDEDQRVRLYATKALGHIGTPAGKAGPRLQSILNSRDEEEGLRSEAKAALKNVNPRRTLVD